MSQVCRRGTRRPKVAGEHPHIFFLKILIQINVLSHSVQEFAWKIKWSLQDKEKYLISALAAI